MAQSWKKTAIGLTGAVLAIFGGAIYLQNSQLLMTSEYRTIKRIVNKLAENNDLGDRLIRFTITAGIYTQWRASDLKLCEEESCNYYSELNPFISHKGKSGNDINEAIRQSYLFNGTEAYVSPTGTTGLARSTFPLYR